MNNVLRVLQIVGKMNRGGLETMIMNLYRSIDRTKVQFDFLVHYSEKGEYDEEILKLGGNIYYFSVMNDYNIVKYNKEINNFFKDHKYTVVHCHWTTLGIFYMKAAKRSGIKTIVAHSHSTRGSGGLKGFLIKLLQSGIESYATDYFACSTEAAYWLFKKETVSSGKVKIIPNAIDTSKYIYDINKRLLVRNRYDVQQNYIIGHVGNFSYAKNHAFLIEIFKSITEKDCTARLWLIGTGILESKVRKQVKENKIADKVVFWGRRTDIADLLQGMDAFILPSHFEGLPLAAIEAQTAGLPCFLSNNITKESDLTDLVEFISLEENPEQWADIIIKAKNHQRENIGMKVKQKGYDINYQAEKMQDFYLEGDLR